jgi:hypothetical protein
MLLLLLLSTTHLQEEDGVPQVVGGSVAQLRHARLLPRPRAFVRHQRVVQVVQQRWLLLLVLGLLLLGLLCGSSSSAAGAGVLDVVPAAAAARGRRTSVAWRRRCRRVLSVGWRC